MLRKSLKRSNNELSDKDIVENAKLFIPTNNDEECRRSNILLTPLILTYLNKEDIIQLSSASKSFRSNLDPYIFQKIKLFPDDYLSNPMQHGRMLNKRGIQAIFLDRVIKTLGVKRQLVKEIVIKDDFNSKYAKKFFSTFSNITSLKIDNVDFKIEILVDILKPLGLLENLHLSLERCKSYSSSTTFVSNYRLPKTIQTVKIECHDYRSSHLDSILAIDETYINLRCYTVTSKEMLNQLKKCHLNIVDLDILNTFVGITDSFEDALVNNPQLKTLTIPGYLRSEPTLNNILAHGNITTFKVKNLNSFPRHNYDNFVHNKMITTIEFINSSLDQFDVVMFNNFNKLQTLKFSSFCSGLNSLDWKTYCGSLKQIDINTCDFISIDFDKMIECKSLNKITLNKNDNEWHHELMVKIDQLKFWQVNKGDQIILKRLI